jgi:hypothetical protein
MIPSSALSAADSLPDNVTLLKGMLPAERAARSLRPDTKRFNNKRLFGIAAKDQRAS